jgi:serine/threonine protein kinase
MALPGGWVVHERIEMPPGKTGSACSVGYFVVGSDGRQGFLKAFDYSAALAADDPPQEFASLFNQYNAERELLEQCDGRKLDRIVRIWASGTTHVPGIQPDAVSYLIFERAHGDARDAVSAADEADHASMLQMAHHAAVGVAQLHSIGGAHQDLKPSNLLFWWDDVYPEAKLGDLGCAYLSGRPVLHDDDRVAGDPTYAAPEQLYDGECGLEPDRRRVAADMYMFGGLVCFLLTGVPYNGIQAMSLDATLGWNVWQGDFIEVLPALVDAHGIATGRLEEVLDRNIASDVAEIIWQLCHPDPLVRGDPKARQYGHNPFGLTRYVSRLNLIHRRASFDARRSA